VFEIITHFSTTTTCTLHPFFQSFFGFVKKASSISGSTNTVSVKFYITIHLQEQL
jgi:hypothetical protein